MSCIDLEYEFFGTIVIDVSSTHDYEPSYNYKCGMIKYVYECFPTDDDYLEFIQNQYDIGEQDLLELIEDNKIDRNSIDNSVGFIEFLNAKYEDEAYGMFKESQANI